MYLQTTTGSETWTNHSAKLHVFHSPTNLQPRQTNGQPQKELHVGVACRDPVSRIRLARPAISHDARPGFRRELGKWDEALYEVQPGQVFKVFGNRTSGRMSPNIQANLFFQMREDAALQRITMSLSAEPTARYSAIHIEGRFDVLSAEQAVALGIHIIPSFRRFFEPEFTRRLYQITQVEAGRPRPVVTQRAVPVSEAITRVNEQGNVEVVTPAQEVIVPIRRRGRNLHV